MGGGERWLQLDLNDQWLSCASASPYVCVCVFSFLEIIMLAEKTECGSNSFVKKSPFLFVLSK